MDTVVGHDHQDQVAQDEAGTQVAGVPGAAGQVGDRVQRVFAACGDVHRVGECRPEGGGEAAVAGVQLTDLLDHETETVPRIGVGEPFVDDGTAGAQLVREGLGGQHLLGREVAVQGGGADPGAPGDLPHRHVHSFGGERRAGRVEDALAVVQSVGAQVVRQTDGHRSHFSQPGRGVY